MSKKAFIRNKSFMNTKYIYLFILSLSLISCDKDDDCCTNIEAGISLSAVTSDGTDHISEIDHDAIKFYYFNGDDFVLVDRPNLDVPKGFVIVPPSDNGSNYYSASILLNIEYLDSNDTSLTRIDWTDSDSDILIAKFDRSNNNILMKTVRIGDEIIWERSENGIVVLEK